MVDPISAGAAGAGVQAIELAKSLPDQAKIEFVRSITSYLGRVTSVVPAIGEGLGKLVTNYAEHLSDVQKAKLDEVLRRAKVKIEKEQPKDGKVEYHVPADKTVEALIDGAAQAGSNRLMDMWATLMADALLCKKVHPMAIEKLQRFSAIDAQVFLELVDQDSKFNGMIEGSLVETMDNAMSLSVLRELKLVIDAEKVVVVQNHDRLIKQSALTKMGQQLACALGLYL